MRYVRPEGAYKDIVVAPAPGDPNKTVNLGVSADTFWQYGNRGMATAIAQYYGIVQEGMDRTVHVFKGLQRPSMLKEDTQADEAVLVYTWRSLVDYEWEGSRDTGMPRLKIPPPRRVFAVIVREEISDDLGVFGAIERWNWIEEDSDLPHAPVGWAQRYGKKLWSR